MGAKLVKTALQVLSNRALDKIFVVRIVENVMNSYLEIQGSLHVSRYLFLGLEMKIG